MFAVSTGDIIVKFLGKSDCGWEFSSKNGLTEQWTAVKKGFTKDNAQEDVTMLTGLSKIANWAFIEGHFDTYANDAYGRNLLEQKGLSAETFTIIFDQDSQERRNIRIGSLSRNNEEDGSNIIMCPLRGQELREYVNVYMHALTKVEDSSSRENDEYSLQFYGLLKEYLKSEKVITQQWQATKDVLAEFAQLTELFEQAVNGAAKFNDPHLKHSIIPSIIEDAKEKLLGA